MAYLQFETLCPISAKNNEEIIVLEEGNEYNLPEGDYFLSESFCVECDCRRTFINVYLNNSCLATIVYGWESISFYKKEFYFENDDFMLEQLKGPCLETFQPQSEFAEDIFEMFMDEFFTDKEYLERIERHYKQFKSELKKRGKL